MRCFYVSIVHVGTLEGWTLTHTLARIMKHLAAMNIIEEVGSDTYAPSPLSNSLTEPKYRDGIIYT